MMDAITAIEKLGGIRPTATKLGVAISTVQGWKERNKIPEARLNEILELLDGGIKTATNNSVAGSNRISKNVLNTKTTQLKSSPRQKLITIITIASMVISLIALGLAVSVPLWQGYLYTPDTVYKPMIKANENSIVQLRDGIVKRSTNLNTRTTEILANLDIATQDIKNIQADLISFKKQTKVRFGIFNEQVLLLRQMSTVALLGEPYGILLSSYTLSVQQQKNIDLQNALATITAHKNGIKTLTYLKSYLKDNARILSPLMADSDSITVWEKVKARLRNLIYIGKVDMGVRSTQIDTSIAPLILMVENNNLQSAIDKARTYNTNSLNTWANHAQNRLNVINAFNVLLGAE